MKKAAQSLLGPEDMGRGLVPGPVLSLASLEGGSRI